jgi:predicted RNase H-like HicB family nuclease
MSSGGIEPQAQDADKRKFKTAMRVELPIVLTQREKWILAWCPVFDVHSQGATEEEARKNIKEALTLFLTTCFEMGTLDQMLMDCGFSADTVPVETEALEHLEYLSIPIPLALFFHLCAPLVWTERDILSF